MKQTIYSGTQATSALTRWLNRRGDPVLLVTGKDSYETSGAAELLAPYLKGRDVTRLPVEKPNPDADDITRKLEIIGPLRERIILAVGGGSVIDTAKLIKSFHGSAHPVLSSLIAGAHPPVPGAAPLLAIPTTAGSGSESTHFAVCYADGIKYSCAAPDLLPNACFLLPDLLHSMPARQRAISALDALCQGIESYWSVHSTEESRTDAANAISILWPALHSGRESGVALSLGSNLAGRAINQSRTTAAHALSYPLTGRFGVPHGHAVALMLPGVFLANSRISQNDCADPRGPDFVKSRIDELAALLGENSPASAVRAFVSLVRSLGLETSAEDLGIACRDSLSTLCADAGGNERMGNNPRRLDPETISTILTEPC